MALSAAGSQARAEAESRVALVVGNGAYQHLPRLDNPVSDAQLIATTLKGRGFTLIGGGAQTDLDRAGFEKAIREFGAALSGGAVGLFYYAGHGVQLQGNNYLVPVGANPTSAADVDFELIDANIVLKQMETAGSKLNFVVLDACRNNPFSGRGLRAAGGGLAQMQAPTGTLISYATQPGNVALDGDNGHSPYTAALAAAMQKPGLRVLDVFNDVGLAVDKRTFGRQRPWVASSPLEGDFYFDPPEGPAAASVAAAGTPLAPAVPAVDPETLFWQTIAQSTNPADFEEYLRQYPNGRFAGLARNRVAHGNPVPEQRVAAVPPPPPAVPPPSGGGRCGAGDDQIMQPVKLLYRAINTKNLDLYAAQWSDDGRYIDVATGRTHTKAEKVEERRGRFAVWEMVNITMDRAMVASRAADRATIKVTYSMTVKSYGRPARSQTGVAEQYDVVCGRAGNWLIQTNIDENR